MPKRSKSRVCLKVVVKPVPIAPIESPLSEFSEAECDHVMFIVKAHRFVKHIDNANIAISRAIKREPIGVAVVDNLSPSSRVCEILCVIKNVSVVLGCMQVSKTRKG
ncbi:hypothetical protein [Planctomycetes bacterium K23_9]|uniref:hypothetical protein n=1 Tax=Stieleria marina TaxID=1930275 RepID=UPI00119E36D3